MTTPEDSGAAPAVAPPEVGFEVEADPSASYDDDASVEIDAVGLEAEERNSTYAAVDLGSNSFHMIVARYADGRLNILDRIKERVAIAEGMQQGGTLDGAAQGRALACLQRFNQRLRHLHAGHVRTLGTNTFRRIRRPKAFVRRASNVLGRRIEIISGHEEARLIYLGVRHFDGYIGQRILVVDIGGGSSEVAIGADHLPELCESLGMGCVKWQQRFFDGEQLSSDAFEAAQLAASQEIEPILGRIRKLKADRIVGSSGTALAISRVLAAEGWTDGTITRDGLAKMTRRLLAKKRIAKVQLAGLKSNRRPVIAGGLAIMCGVFDSLKLESMIVSEAALREGVLVDMIDRGVDDADSRERSIRALAHQFGVDRGQARRVAETACQLFDAAAPIWRLTAEDRKFLRWGARLHELGLAVSHNDYHKHGAYLARNADLSGFSRDEQAQLAGLIYNHRRKLREEQLGRAPEEVEHFLRIALLLRLAVYLHRSRTGAATPPMSPLAGERGLALRIPEPWLEEHPLTGADLAAESDLWRTVGYQLTP